MLEREQEPENSFLPSRLIETITTDLLINHSIYNLPEITSIEPVAGGVAHYVYRINTSDEVFYLKIRGNSFSKIPTIKSNPTDIKYEHQAIILLSKILPHNFPRVVHFDPEKAFMILTDAIPNGETLETLLNEQRVTPQMMENLGKTLRNIHYNAKAIPGSIRENEDIDFFATKLRHRFGYQNNPVLNDLVDNLTNNQPRQIIIGDPSPKNMGVNNSGNSIILFDLEDVHKGNTVFDIGFILGHAILHAYYDPNVATDFVEKFLNGYGNNSEQRLLKIIVLGTILYRLNSVVPYNINLSDEEKRNLIQNVEKTLATVDFNQLTWADLIHSILISSEKTYETQY